VNAPLLAKERGIKITESKSETAHDFINLITLKVKTQEMESTISGTLFGKFEPRIVRLNNFRLEAVPEGHMLLITSVDRPGVIGAISATLGKHSINIERMHVGQEKDQGMNVILLTTDQILLPSVLKAWSGRRWPFRRWNCCKPYRRNILQNPLLRGIFNLPGVG
jgi:D-3-phosphoglycerate dehydrogenase